MVGDCVSSSSALVKLRPDTHDLSFTAQGCQQEEAKEILLVLASTVIGYAGRRRRLAPAPFKVVPEDLCYATVRKKREQGCVKEIVVEAVFSILEVVESAFERSRVSRAINTAFIERHNGSHRARKARKARKTYCFSRIGKCTKR